MRAKSLMLDEQNSFMAGRPRFHVAAWEEALLDDPEGAATSANALARAKTVVRWVRTGFSVQFRDAAAAPHEKREKVRAMLRQMGITGQEAEQLMQGHTPPPMEFRNLQSALKHSAFMDETVEKGVSLGIFQPVQDRPHVVNPMGVVEGSKLREIMHGSYVSLWMHSPPFSYETIKEPMKYIQQGDWLFTVDAKSGYYHIPVEEASRTYLGFQWRGQYYVYTVLPMGIGPACWAYTMVMAHVLRPLRRRGWLLSSYIDDSIYTAASMREALGKVLVLLRYMAALGIYLSRKKCLLWPGHEAAHLGKVIDTLSLSLHVPDNKMEEFVSLAQELAAQRTFPPRQLARVAGKLISFLPAVTAAPLFVKTLYACVRGERWDAELLPQQQMVETLQWLAQNAHSMNGATWAAPGVAMVVKVDAGEFGWGATIEAGPRAGARMMGALPEEALALSSTHRETAAYSAAGVEIVRVMAAELRGARLQLVGDNQAAVQDDNKMGKAA